MILMPRSYRVTSCRVISFWIDVWIFVVDVGVWHEANRIAYADRSTASLAVSSRAFAAYNNAPDSLYRHVYLHQKDNGQYAGKHSWWVPRIPLTARLGVGDACNRVLSSGEWFVYPVLFGWLISQVSFLLGSLIRLFYCFVFVSGGFRFAPTPGYWWVVLWTM